MRRACAGCWYLFAGDETSLPPIARMLEALPDDARGTVLLEVAGPEEVQELTAPAGIDIGWLFRDADAPQPRRLAQAVVEVPVPESGRVAC